MRRHRCARIATAAFGAAVAVLVWAPPAGAATVCAAEPRFIGELPAIRAPTRVLEHLRARGNDPVEFNQLCAAWAGESVDFGRRRRPPSVARPAAPVRLIFVPATGQSVASAGWALEQVFELEFARKESASFFGVAIFTDPVATSTVLAVVASPSLAYAEPDCDGPDFAMTSARTETSSRARGESPCWRRAAREQFPNDPCLPELWGHDLIGWTGEVARDARPRLVAVLDSGVNCAHEELAANIWRGPRSLGSLLAARTSPTGCNLRSGRDFTQIERRGPDDCDAASGCNPHGTEMAGTIAGIMNNGIGLTGVAPRSKLMPVRISKVEHGNLVSLSAIARAILFAGRSGAHVINVSAKWPVHSYAVYRAIRMATEGATGARRLLVTGYVGSIGDDNRFHEAFPSSYRCLPGVLASVPIGASRHGALEPVGDSSTSEADGRIAAPGVDIVVTTTENRASAYDIEPAGGASSAAAYVSGSIALAWGTPPLQKCDAGSIRKIMFCRARRSGATRHPIVNVEFLRELAQLDSRSSCTATLETLGCGP
jgi:hypothetical protein